MFGSLQILTGHHSIRLQNSPYFYSASVGLNAARKGSGTSVNITSGIGERSWQYLGEKRELFCSLSSDWLLKQNQNEDIFYWLAKKKDWTASMFYNLNIAKVSTLVEHWLHSQIHNFCIVFNWLLFRPVMLHVYCMINYFPLQFSLHFPLQFITMYYSEQL